MSTLIIHHGGCPDGFGSAYMFGKWLDQTTRHEKLGAQHSDEAPDVTDRDVVMLDFVYDDVEKVRRIAQTAKSLLILDHHQTAWGVLGQVEEISLHDEVSEGLGSFGDGLRTAVINRQSVVTHDGALSGVGMVVKWISLIDPNYSPPWWWRYVQDRDLWKFELPLTRAVMASIAARPYTVEAWDEITREMGAIIANGEAVERFRQTLIDDAVRGAWFVPIRQFYMAQAPYTIGSDVAGILAGNSESKMGGYVVLSNRGVKIGLRSLEDGPDVAEIAETYGGGGHKHAAGFLLSIADARAWLP